MNPQETQVLQDFLNQLTQVRGIVKDPQADAMISRAVAQQPDAAYLLAQRALLLDQALSAAKAQISTLQSQLEAGAPASRGFLDPNAWGNSAGSRPAAAPPMRNAPASTQYAQQQYAQEQYPAQQYAQQAPAARSGFFGGGLRNTLGTVAATAAGVAGGAFLFQGLENLLGHHGGSGLLGQDANPASSLTSSESTPAHNFFEDQPASDTSSAPDTPSNTDDSLVDDGSSLLDDGGSDDGLFS
jgi:hypothetical protein